MWAASNMLNKDNEGKDRNDVTKEELDIYDTVLEYLLSDVVDTEESAVAIMPHLSEGYIESILQLDENRRAARSAGGYKDDSKKQTDPSKDGFTGISGSIKEIMRQNKEIEASNKAKKKS